MASPDRMPPLGPATMTPAQAQAAQALTDGPRGGVRGPFIPLLRSPELMDRLQKLGEYLRFNSALPARIERARDSGGRTPMDTAVRMVRTRGARTRGGVNRKRWRA